MKHLHYYLTVFMLLLLGNVSVIADEYDKLYPESSTEESEYWYYIRFKKMGFVVQDMGNEENLMTQNMSKNNAQLWKFIGNRENGYIIQSKDGRYIYYVAGENRYKATEDKNKATLLYAAPSLHPSEPYHSALELTRSTESNVRFNQMQGGGVNKTINEYTVGETNPLEFIAYDNAVFPIERLEEVPYTASQTTPESQNILWYQNPSTKWMTSSLPIGNGQLGAMIYGGIHQEQIQFNEKTLWTGTPCKDGDYFTGMRGAYQNFGSIFINTLDITEASDYQRSLDIQNAVAKVNYTSNGVHFERKYIASNPDQAIIINYTADHPGSISIQIFQEDAHQKAPIYQNGTVTVDGKLETVTFNSYLKVVPKGGTMTTSAAEGICVKNADEVMIVLKAGTDYDPLSPTYTSNTENFAQDIKTQVEKVTEKEWNDILDAHKANFRSFFDRVCLNLTDEANSKPTAQLVRDYSQAVKNGQYGSLLLEQLYFNYGRYLLISSSRGIVQPANLQGIWNDSNTPPWSSDIHANINVQMNYWPAEPTNLSDLHEIFLNYNYNEALKQPQWHANAYYSKKEIIRKLYGDAEAEKVTPEDAKGWVCYTANNIFGGGGTFMMNNVSANAWNCMHLWQHYRYTLDRDYLLKKAYPVMKSCCEFWMDRLIEDRGAKKGSNPHIMKDFAPDGTLVAPLEYSPENGPDAEDGVTHAQQLCWDLFRNTLEAIEVLGEDVAQDKSFAEELMATFAKLDPGTHIDDDGYLKEWKYSERTAGQSQHRHNSHLMGLYPGNQISAQIDKKIFDAAVKSLTARGDKGTSWSIGWKINLWARALDGEHAYKIARESLTFTENTNNGGGWGGGIYENLLSAGPPYQIDGNFGYTSGVAEMLLQSHTDTLHFLPALPARWANGSVTGLCAVGGFETDIFWEDSEISSVTIRSKQGQRCPIYLGEYQKAEVTDNAGNSIETQKRGQVIIFNTEKGKEYKILFSDKKPQPAWTTAFFPISKKEDLQQGTKYILRNCFVSSDKGDRSGYVAVASPMAVTKGMDQISSKSVFSLNLDNNLVEFQNEEGNIPAKGNQGGGLEPGTGNDFFEMTPCEGKEYHFQFQSTVNNLYLNANTGTLTFWNENPHPYQIYQAQEITEQGVTTVTLDFEDKITGTTIKSVQKNLRTGTVPAYGEILAEMPQDKFWKSLDGKTLEEIKKNVSDGDPFGGITPAGEEHKTYKIGLTDETTVGLENIKNTEKKADLYLLNGMKIRTNVSEKEILRDQELPKGIYLWNNKKFIK